jgi:hypothetical protein
MLVLLNAFLDSILNSCKIPKNLGYNCDLAQKNGIFFVKNAFSEA